MNTEQILVVADPGWPWLSKRCCTCHNVGAGPSIMMKLSLMMSTKEITAMKRLDIAQVVPDAAVQ